MMMPHFLEVILRREACIVLDRNTKLSDEIAEKLGELCSEVTKVREQNPEPITAPRRPS